MNEFKDLDLPKLLMLKEQLKSYLKGIKDYNDMIQNIYKKTECLYHEKIRLCQEEIDKQTGNKK